MRMPADTVRRLSNSGRDAWAKAPYLAILKSDPNVTSTPPTSGTNTVLRVALLYLAYSALTPPLTFHP